MVFEEPLVLFPLVQVLAPSSALASVVEAAATTSSTTLAFLAGGGSDSAAAGSCTELDIYTMETKG